MALISYSVHHASHGLDAVARAHACRDGLERSLVDADERVRGVVVIATCNRFEVLLDLSEAAPALEADLVRRLSVDNPTYRCGKDVITHVMRVAAGLDSLVVGEREISGQVRRALTVAHNERTASVTLTRILQASLSASRRVAQLTGLASQGRSVVAAGLDLVAKCRGPLEGGSALIVGTGSYAGATVAALRARALLDISVYSSSGRADAFATGHGLRAVASEGLTAAMAAADLTITCRGLGAPILTRREVARARAHRDRDLVIVDLALTSDLEEGVAREPGVRVITMDDIRAAVPGVQTSQIDQAETIVEAAVEESLRDLRTREAVPAVIAVRDYINSALADEVDRLPKEQTISREAAILALRRLSAKLAHTPTVRAREAASAGHTDEFARALERVIGVSVGERARDLEWDVCPATGLSFSDLHAHARPSQQEAV